MKGPGELGGSRSGKEISQIVTSVEPKPLVGEVALLHLKTLGWSLSDNLGFGKERKQWFSNFISGLLYTFEHC